MNTENVFGLAHLWATGDAVSHGVAVLLVLMSLASWFWILYKVWHWLRLRNTPAAIEQFWSHEDPVDGLRKLKAEGPDAPAAVLAEAADRALRKLATRSSQTDRAEFLTRTLRQSIARSHARLEQGLTLLASIGATAPFVGLFGTVWGIYHALVAVSVSGQATLDKVAGPVGEALIMTAAGIAVALPAVLAYNAFNRTNRVLMGELDAFAHDLHASHTTGLRVSPDSSGRPDRERPTPAAPGRAAEGAR